MTEQDPEGWPLGSSRAQELTFGDFGISAPSAEPIQRLTPRPLEQPPPSGGVSSCHAAQGFHECGVAWLLECPSMFQRGCATPHPCARVNGSALPSPGWLGKVMEGRASLPRLRWLSAWGPAALQPWAPGAHRAALGLLWLMARSLCGTKKYGLPTSCGCSQ